MKNFRKILSILSALNYKKKFFLFIILTFFGTILEMLGVSMIIPIITVLYDQNYFYSLNKFTSYLLFYNLNQNELVFYLFLFLFAFFTIKSIFLTYLIYFQNNFIYSLKEKLSNFIFARYLYKNYLWHKKINSSILIRNTNTEVMYFGFSMISFTNMLMEIFILMGITTLLFIYNFQISILISIIFMLPFALFLKNIKKKIKFWGIERQQIDANILKNLQQGFGSVKDVILKDKQVFFLNNFKILNKKSKILDIYYNLFQNLPKIFLELLAITGIFVIIYYSFEIKNYNSLYVLTFLSLFAVSAFRILPSISRIISNFQTYKYYVPSIDVLNDEIKIDTLLQENKISFEANDLDTHASQNFYAFKKFEIKSLNFQYSNSDSVLFDNLNFDFKSGTTLGIVGKSGVGKSTFVDIIMGLIDRALGSIYVNDVNLSKKNVKKWRQLISYVPQNIYLLDDTISKNIAFGETDEQIRPDKIRECLNYSQMLNFVNSLPQKENTLVGERGARLSGGQIQRLAIARALYSECKIIIFDEATSALDKTTEEDILHLIKSLKTKKTILMISHNLDSLKYCDKIFEVKNKKIIEKE